MSDAGEGRKYPTNSIPEIVRKKKNKESIAKVKMKKMKMVNIVCRNAAGVKQHQAVFTKQ